jgi:KUP system potassium uptake protein
MSENESAPESALTETESKPTAENGDSHVEPDKTPHGRYLLVLSLGALGVVYGDIGTSPLYALRECFYGRHSVVAPTTENVLGVLSLIFWSLIIVISVKYLIFVMRADNRGEGGILALMSLVRPDRGRLKSIGWVVVLGLFGAALLYGDGIITPAISVLSAVEGLRIATPMSQHTVIAITMIILVLLFVLQSRGTAKVGAIFGPVTLLWFITLAVLGISQIVQEPHVFGAINPVHGVKFFLANGWRGFLTLGSVFLVVTGGEALYADMGHFGVRPIRLAWFALVLPALLLNYFGQGALLLHHPDVKYPLFQMAPRWALYPLVFLATAATVIASQAVISGAFSLTRQAVQLGFSPRVTINHTSAREIGQIYIPGINWTLMILTLWLVWAFKTSSALAAAYGVAVTTTMVITTILLYLAARRLWGWGPLKAGLLMAFFLVIDLAFFGANIIKFPQGGWVPLVVAAIIFLLMTTWRRGREILGEKFRELALPDDLFVSSLQTDPPIRVPGIAIFMDRTPDATPHALLHNVKHNKILHEKVILLTVLTEEKPHVPEEQRYELTERGNGVYRLVIRYGFMEDPHIPRVLEKIKIGGAELKAEQVTFFLGRESLLATEKPGMAIWREHLFVWMSRNALSAAHFYDLPANRVIEIGAQVEL